MREFAIKNATFVLPALVLLSVVFLHQSSSVINMKSEHNVFNDQSQFSSHLISSVSTIPPDSTTSSVPTTYSVLSALVKTLSTSDDFNNHQLMEAAVVAALQHEQVKDAVVYNHKMELLVHNNKDDSPLPLRYFHEKKFHKKMNASTLSGLIIEDSSVLYHAPIYHGRQLMGLAVIAASEKRSPLRSSAINVSYPQSYDINGIRLFIISTIVCILFLSLVSWIFSWGFGKKNKISVQRTEKTEQKSDSTIAGNANSNYAELSAFQNCADFQAIFDIQLSNSIRSEKQLALLFLDLDNYKSVNDIFGYQAGDFLLQELRERVNELIRLGDIVTVPDMPTLDKQVARCGDKFIILLPFLDESTQAALVCRRILEAINKPFMYRGMEIYVHAGIGVAMAPTDGSTIDQLVRNANIAMKQSKKRGRNQYNFFSKALNKKVQRQYTLETQLRRAMGKDQFSMVYQAKIDGITGSVVGVEALIRWHHPQLGWISPNVFIPIAEESGLIETIGQWVISTCCSQLAQWKRNGFDPFPLALNISAIQLQNGDIADTISKHLKKHGLSPMDLEIELTETALLNFEESALYQLNLLRDRGHYIWLDDFGTAYSSLGLLRKFPINGLKIDKSFVKNIYTNEDDQQIIAGVAALANTMGLGLTAEGVETEEQAAILAEHRCNHMQGFWFQKPMSSDEFMRFFVKNKRLVSVNTDEEARRYYRSA